MPFLKSLKIRKGKKGQASVEFFVLFAIVAVLTIVSLNAHILDNIKAKAQEQFILQAMETMRAP